MPSLTAVPQLQFEGRASWRAWLEANHGSAGGAWLIMWKLRSGRTGLDYEAAIEEALCFGWVDGTAGAVDEHRRKLYFAPRKPRSGWAASNKSRIERLIREGRMAPAGLAAVERAMANGSWTMLDSAERLEVPDDLAAALASNTTAAANFAAFPSSARKQLLGWIAMARRPETRAIRIARVAEAAARNERTPG
jgi:uncharacterized protein YdeI (YjbR/CyaY-like superfamily)